MKIVIHQNYHRLHTHNNGHHRRERLHILYQIFLSYHPNSQKYQKIVLLNLNLKKNISKHTYYSN